MCSKFGSAILFCSSKKGFFLDVKMLWLRFFGLFVKLDFIYGSFLCILGPFLKVKLLNGGIFCVGEIKKKIGGGDA